VLTQPKSFFEAFLGIRAPWSIQEVVLDEKRKSILIELDYAQEKPKFSFFAKNGETSATGITHTGTTKRWAHTSFGFYSCYISSVYANRNISNLGIEREVLLQPAFLGDLRRNYTHQLRQQVAMLNQRGLAADAIAQQLVVEQSVVDEVLQDLERAPDNYRLPACLPTEIDPIWERIITDKLHLKTQAFSLRLLLSKLKLNFFDTQNETLISDSINELRKYFIAHAPSLEAEYQQVCALSVKKAVVEERAASASKLVLPGLKNGIWLKLISGKVNLNSANVSLNLLLVRSRHAFQHAVDAQHRLLVLNSVREFFKKNARQLRPELVLINQLMHAPEEAQYTLPDEKHHIWQRILKDDTFIPSSHIAYKLLLANLRSQLLMNPDPVVELSAARRVRDFMKQNQRFMESEYRMVLNSSYS
jgi:hypothetical protein